MDIKVIFFTLLCSFSVTAMSASDNSNEIKYAISYCLSTTYPDSVFSKDAGYISGAYLQKGSYGLHVYESIRNFVNDYVKNKYVSKHNRDLSIMQCIDLSSSNSLIAVIEKVANKSLQ
jgi:hypothetical protein